jgi:serralysin
VIANDGANNTTQAVVVSVTNVNEAPVFTSAATASFAENSTGTAYTATATDVDAGTTLTYTLGGTDSALFNISATSGAVTFKVSPDYEAPTDAGANNVYDITVTASDGSLTATQAVAITVTNLNDTAPVFTSGGTGTVAENAATSTVIYTAATTDADNLAARTYTVSGTDAGLVDITSAGVVTLKASADYESKTSYSFNVIANDGANNTTQAVVVSVTNVYEAPAITSAAAVTFSENGTGAAYSTAATVDSTKTLTYSLSGTDSALFNISATSGAVTFKVSPDYEAPTDAGANNV